VRDARPRKLDKFPGDLSSLLRYLGCIRARAIRGSSVNNLRAGSRNVRAPKDTPCDPARLGRSLSLIPDTGSPLLKANWVRGCQSIRHANRSARSRDINEADRFSTRPEAQGMSGCGPYARVRLCLVETCLEFRAEDTDEKRRAKQSAGKERNK